MIVKIVNNKRVIRHTMQSGSVQNTHVCGNRFRPSTFILLSLTKGNRSLEEFEHEKLVL